MGEESLDEWFRRRSPSRWMREPLNSVNTAMAAGWAKDRAAKDLAEEVLAAASAAIGRAVLTFARSAQCAHASREEELVWGAWQGEQR